MGARRPKPTALKERTSVRPQLGLSRLFAAANALVPFHKSEDEPPAPERHLRVASQTAECPTDDKTLKLDDPRLKNAPSKTRSAAQEKARQPQETRRASHAHDDLAVTRATSVRPLFNPNSRADSGADADSEYGTAVVVPNRKRNKAATTDETKTQPIGARTSITKLQKQEARKRELSSKTLALFFLIPAIGLASYAFFTSADGALTGTAARKSALTPEQIKERVDYYRHLTGQRLNRQRIDVQIQNFQEAPALSALDQKVKPPNMMEGLPLVGEKNAFTRNPKGDLPADPTYSEAKVGYGLQEEQDRIEFEKRAQKAWIKEFVENARKDGYEVKIDRFGNVEAKEIPLKDRGPY